jgi:hypothetical protein
MKKNVFLIMLKCFGTFKVLLQLASSTLLDLHWKIQQNTYSKTLINTPCSGALSGTVGAGGANSLVAMVIHW